MDQYLLEVLGERNTRFGEEVEAENKGESVSLSCVQMDFCISVENEMDSGFKSIGELTSRHQNTARKSRENLNSLDFPQCIFQHSLFPALNSSSFYPLCGRLFNPWVYIRFLSI